MLCLTKKKKSTEEERWKKKKKKQLGCKCDAAVNFGICDDWMRMINDIFHHIFISNLLHENITYYFLDLFLALVFVIIVAQTGAVPHA